MNKCMFIFREKQFIYTYIILFALKKFWNYLEELKKKIIRLYLNFYHIISRKILRKCIEFSQIWHPSVHSKTFEQNFFLKSKYLKILRFFSGSKIIRERDWFENVSTHFLWSLCVSIHVSSCVRVVDDRRPQVAGEERGEKEKEEEWEEVWTERRNVFQTSRGDWGKFHYSQTLPPLL